MDRRVLGRPGVPVSDRVAPTTGVSGADPDASSPQPSAHDLAGFFDLSLDLLCVAGPDGHLKHLNPAWTQVLGWTAEELKSRPLLEFVHPDDRVSTAAETQKLAGGATTILFVNRCRCRDGGHRWLQWNARAARGDGLIYAAGRDITRQKQLEREIIQIADREKEHFGRELHDSVCQRMAGIGALSTTLSRRLRASGDAASSDAAEEISGLLSDTLRQVRNLSHSLAPPVLRESNIGDSLQALALQCEHLFGVTCTVACKDTPESLSAEVKLHLLRIAQEALSNAVIHGHADRIEIEVRRTAGRCLVTILDNGSGIGDPDQGYAEGIGLRSMAYRAGLIGGYLKVTRRLRQGTAVICIFPLPLVTAGEEGRLDGSE
jgi:PAS domain S-box-containing protein